MNIKVKRYPEMNNKAVTNDLAVFPYHPVSIVIAAIFDVSGQGCKLVNIPNRKQLPADIQISFILRVQGKVDLMFEK